jgi:hypothetical protein
MYWGKVKTRACIENHFDDTHMKCNVSFGVWKNIDKANFLSRIQPPLRRYANKKMESAGAPQTKKRVTMFFN